jgi:NAD(P)H dehydrogenase (quinone)
MSSQSINAPQGKYFEHLIVCANPSPKSFDHAIVEAYAEAAREQGQHVVVRDLYAFRFDPVLRLEERPGQGAHELSPDVEAELAFVRSADVIVLVYPIWYGLPPAILKGYVDRVLGAGYSYRDFHAQRGQEWLEGKPLVSISTSGLPLTWLREKGQTMSLREIVDVYLWRGFGMKQSQHLMIDSVEPNMSAVFVDEQLERVRQTARQTCALLADEPFGDPVYES